MRATQRLRHLSEASLAAVERFGDVGWNNEETQAIALAVAMIDQAILAREEREGAPAVEAVPLALKTVEEHITDRINEQVEWIRTHGATEEGYIERYGSADDPEHFGDGGEAIFAADQDALRTLLAERARVRHPSQQYTNDELREAAELPPQEQS